MTLHIHGMGEFHPPTEITNRFLEDLDIGTDNDWIVDRTGIRTRRTVLPLDYLRDTRNRDTRCAGEASEYTNAEMSARAAAMAIARAGVSASSIGLIIAGSSTPDTTAPAEAANTAFRLGLEIPSIDVHSACTSLLAAMWMISLMDSSRAPELVLVVVAEGLTRVTDYGDRESAVLFGDGAAAAVVSLRERGRAELLGCSFSSFPSGCTKVVIPRVGHFHQTGRVVQKLAIQHTSEEIERLRGCYGRDDRAFHFIGHQANLRMLEAACRLADVPCRRHQSNVEWFGNTGCAGGGTVLSQTWDKWTDEDDVAFVGVGAGFSRSAGLLRFRSGS